MRLLFLCILLYTFSSTIIGQNDYVESTVSRNNAYALALYSSYNKNFENLAFSPFGVSTCMAMAYIGSEGKVQQQIAEKMNFITPFGVLFGFKQLIKRFQIYKSNDINLLIDNALWTNNQYDLQKKYKNLLKANFTAHVQELSFKANSEKNAKTINRWVKKSSNFNIRSIIRPENISEDDNLIYTNYVYLNGNWENPFNDQFTSKSDFYLIDSTKVKVDFMNQTSYLRYNENDIFQILELPYAGRNISMIIILPKEQKYLDSLEHSLNPINFDFWNGELYTKLVSLSLPKFRIEFSEEFSSFIKDSGLELAFTDKADYSRISKDKVYISQIIQKTVIEVEENKNSNFTELVVSLDEIEKSNDNTFMRFKADHPFIFIVKDNLNNSILIAGKVVFPNFSNLSAENFN
ncbi:MAG: serpin family protein [Bacteroidales bacterium]|nr:serpin family protein [Bacteroidales bacterium]